MQTSPYNQSSLPTIVGVAVTTDRRLAAIPGNVLLPASVTDLSEDSVADVTQVATVDRRHLDERVGTVPPWLLADVERGLRRVLGL
jgi:mRNA interferase MazF